MIDTIRAQQRLPERRLFERLAMPESPVEMTRAERLERAAESIKRHLIELLNSHPGGSESVPALGLLDFNDATLGAMDLELNIRRAIRQCIESFEPRVEHVVVETLQRGRNPLQLRFKVHATLAAGADETRATIDLLLDDRHYLVLN